MKKWLLVSIMCCFASLSQAAPVYVELTPEFVVNYNESGRLKYLKAQITVRAVDDLAAIELNYHSDYLRHELILLLSRQTSSTVNSTEGRETMLQEATRLVQNIMRLETGKPQADQLFFTNFFAR